MSSEYLANTDCTLGVTAQSTGVPGPSTDMVKIPYLLPLRKTNSVPDSTKKPVLVNSLNFTAIGCSMGGYFLFNYKLPVGNPLIPLSIYFITPSVGHVYTLNSSTYQVIETSVPKAIPPVPSFPAFDITGWMLCSRISGTTDPTAPPHYPRPNYLELQSPLPPPFPPEYPPTLSVNPFIPYPLIPPLFATPYIAWNADPGTFVTGGGNINTTATNNIHDDLKPLRRNDNGTCRGIFIFKECMKSCQCNFNIDNAGQATEVWT